jgi:hypothetical protein
VGLAAAALFAPVVHTAVYAGVSDFKWHARAAAEWAQGAPLPTPHFLFQAVLVALAPLSPGVDWTRRAVWIAIACQAALAMIVCALLRDAVPSSRPVVRTALAGAVTLALVFVTPVTFASWAARNLYHGYVGIAVYHNPTLILLKPFAVLLWWETARALDGAPRPAAWLAALTILSGLAKPSHLIALLPAAAALAAVLAWKGRASAWRPLVLGLALPSAIALGWQFAFRYGGAASVEWAPWTAMAYRDAHLGARFVLSALFPLVVLALFPRALLRDRALALAAATFAVGAAYAYLLAEGGDTFTHRNFAWSAQSALFVLFVAAARVVLRESADASARARVVMCAAALALHVACGAYFAIHPTWW